MTDSRMWIQLKKHLDRVHEDAVLALAEADSVADSAREDGDPDALGAACAVLDAVRTLAISAVSAERIVLEQTLSDERLLRDVG